MHSRTRLLAAALIAALTALFGSACDLVETCDPAVDPNCTADPDPDAGGGQDVVVGGECGDLGEGQSRCQTASSVARCTGGQLVTERCQTGDFCEAGACTEALRYVRIIDLTDDTTGQHPGADIDAIELLSGGVPYYANEVTDSFIPNDVGENRAPNPTEILGPPHTGGTDCNLADGQEHWISLAGGEIVVAFADNRELLPGDRITVYECAGAAQDTFDITVGVSSRLEGAWTPILEDASGTVTVTVP
jgi:hypothetical protein